jgi:hypothetical protein
MKQQEYIEGPKALENFEQFAAAILQVPKPTVKRKKQPDTAISRTPKKADKEGHS